MGAGANYPKMPGLKSTKLLPQISPVIMPCENTSSKTCFGRRLIMGDTKKALCV